MPGLNPTYILLFRGQPTSLVLGDVVRVCSKTNTMSIARQGEPLQWYNPRMNGQDDKHVITPTGSHFDVWSLLSIMSAVSGLSCDRVDRGPDCYAFKMTVAGMPAKTLLAA